MTANAGHGSFTISELPAEEGFNAQVTFTGPDGQQRSASAQGEDPTTALWRAAERAGTLELINAVHARAPRTPLP